MRSQTRSRSTRSTSNYQNGYQYNKRSESCKIDLNSMEIVGRAGTDSILSDIQAQCTTLCALQNQETQSLGFINPTINNLSIDSSSEHRQKAKKFNKQRTLGGGNLPVMILPHQVRFHFDCDPHCETEHKVLCEDIYFCNKYWEFDYKSDSASEIEDEYSEWMEQFSDMYFMVGTHHRWGTWLVISLLTPQLL